VVLKALTCCQRIKHRRRQLRVAGVFHDSNRFGQAGLRADLHTRKKTQAALASRIQDDHMHK
jgi:hypothetical protein